MFWRAGWDIPRLWIIFWMSLRKVSRVKVVESEEPLGEFVGILGGK